jgi:hypothetical protein
MQFKEATDELFLGINHDELAASLGVSIASIRQARLQSSAKAHRRPPDNWEGALVGLAEQRIRHYRRLIEKLQGRLSESERDSVLPPVKTGGAKPRRRSAEG